MTSSAVAGFSSADFVRFLLVLVRCLAMFAIMPIFSSRMIPVQLRVGLAMLIAFFVGQTLPALAPFRDVPSMVIAVVAQVAIGATFGFVAGFIFYGIQFAGEIIDTQVGFAISNIINPLTGTQVTLLGQFEIILATLLFLTTDSHLVLLQGVAGSFHLVPLPYAALAPALLGDVMHLFYLSLMIVFKIASPVAVSLFVTNIALALLTRVAPQINVFIVGLPAQLGIGLLMFVVSLPIFGYVVPAMLHELPGQLDTTLRLMAPPAR